MSPKPRPWADVGSWAYPLRDCRELSVSFLFHTKASKCSLYVSRSPAVYYMSPMNVTLNAVEVSELVELLPQTTPVPQQTLLPQSTAEPLTSVLFVPQTTELPQMTDEPQTTLLPQTTDEPHTTPLASTR